MKDSNGQGMSDVTRERAARDTGSPYESRLYRTRTLERECRHMPGSGAWSPTKPDHTDTHWSPVQTVCATPSPAVSQLYAHRRDTVSAVPPPCTKGQTPRSQPTSPPGVRILSLKGRQLKGVAGVALSFHVGGGGRALQQPQQHLHPRSLSHLQPFHPRSLSHVQPSPHPTSPTPVCRVRPRNYYHR